MVPGALAVVIGFGGGRHRIAVIDRDRPHSDGPVPVEEVDEALRTVFGLDLGPYDATWTSHFRINERRARTNRSGRVLLAGDAAHVHSPVGAQGLNLGVQDATNLGWKLAAVVAGRAGEELLDTYAEERRRVCLEVIVATALATRVATARRLPVRAARQLGLRGVARFPGIRRRALARVNGTSHRYRSTAGRRRRGPAGAMVGRRVPDLGLSDGRRLYEVLRSGGFVLVDQGAGSRPPVPDAWDDLVTHLPGRVRGPRGPWLGTELFLVRPDGYCAWAGPRSRAAGDLAVVLPCWAGRRNVPRERAGAWPAG
ncbi:hypothetical protein AQ490_19910 [Wenjunlia vitaminophila]|uniref:FAD-binding domain-containing protein n=1 Tax=Wenjunlia vitaminophila TaxID=76728 RepID=A0A0T6LUA6_WENVI|nr:FAD-dependent monooxygenase [Wenjunlia vitaminophila]KRV49590.1 hypothetical protein AQ490_19910 [Wenjunlia vitaminophila]